MVKGTCVLVCVVSRLHATVGLSSTHVVSSTRTLQLVTANALPFSPEKW